jgi:hypothetical protein
MGRLQEIKTEWIQEKETYQYRELAITPDDIEWLIKQAELKEKWENWCGRQQIRLDEANLQIKFLKIKVNAQYKQKTNQ